MKVYLYSDLHLECGDAQISKNITKKDIVIIAGDLCLWDNEVNKSIGMDFLYDICHKADKVLYVLGNHEYWRSKYQDVLPLVRELTQDIPNLIILENESVLYNNVLFVGCTLWTDFDNMDPLLMYTAKDRSNDYKRITWHEKGIYRSVRPDDLYIINQKSKKFLFDSIKEHKGSVCVITHMAPSSFSSSPEYKGSPDSGLYVNNYENKIYNECPNLKWYVHGHLHSSSDYYIGETRIMCNPHGYNFKKTPMLNRDYNPEFYFEI